MNCLEMVVVFPPEGRMRERKDEAEHQLDKNVRRNHIGEGPFVSGMVSGGYRGVHDATLWQQYLSRCELHLESLDN